MKFQIETQPLTNYFYNMYKLSAVILISQEFFLLFQIKTQ